MAAAASSSSSSSSFKRFDVVSDASDHVFLNDSVTLTGRARKKIMQEWRILECGLPDSIHVRVFETRIDLMRAAIVGAKGTPYHDGLYFFDIKFPSNFPDAPPTVRYRSHGLRINPNLYACGKVCLSLLDTWAGSRSERWDPDGSTVLQVLVSIQALVLNEKPYFNEPGTGVFGRPVRESASRAYSEGVFLLACKTATHLLRDKPGSFEDFVVEHFRERAGAILGACAAYASGRVMVGYFGVAAAAASEPGRSRRRRKAKAAQAEVSENFREAMELVYNSLVEALKENAISVGADEEDFGEVMTRETAAFPGAERKRREGKGGWKSGIVKKVVDKFRKVFGLSKNDNQYVTDIEQLFTDDIL